jgi:cysteine/histidine-rich domain-containing protein
VSCRYDWHQTSSYVVVSVFAKKYDPDSSSVQLNPVRLKVHLFFPEEQSVFNLDLELCGVRMISCYSIQICLSGEVNG